MRLQASKGQGIVDCLPARHEGAVHQRLTLGWGTVIRLILLAHTMSANEIDHARTLLNRIPAAVQHACDLDLLVFFAKHPRTLMAREDIARLLGYELKEIAKSLEVLFEAGLLTRTKNPTRARRLYVFETGGTNSAWLPEFVEFASTREGRMELRLALTQEPRSDDEQRRKR